MLIGHLVGLVLPLVATIDSFGNQRFVLRGGLACIGSGSSLRSMAESSTRPLATSSTSSPLPSKIALPLFDALSAAQLRDPAHGESAALSVDVVFPEQPIHQWVPSFPYPLRFLFASRPAIMGQVLNVVYGAIATHLMKKVRFCSQDG